MLPATSWTEALKFWSHRATARTWVVLRPNHPHSDSNYDCDRISLVGCSSGRGASILRVTICPLKGWNSFALGINSVELLARKSADISTV